MAGYLRATALLSTFVHVCVYASACDVLVYVQVQLLQQERSSEATSANPDQEAALEAAIRAETDFLMQVSV